MSIPRGDFEVSMIVGPSFPGKTQSGLKDFVIYLAVLVVIM